MPRGTVRNSWTTKRRLVCLADIQSVHNSKRHDTTRHVWKSPNWNISGRVQKRRNCSTNCNYTSNWMFTDWLLCKTINTSYSMASNPLVLGIPLQKQVTRHNIHSVYCTLVCLHLHVQDLHQIRRCIFRDKKKYSQFIVIVASSIRQTNHYTDCHNLEQNSVIVCVCVCIYIYILVSGSLSTRHGASSGCGWRMGL